MHPPRPPRRFTPAHRQRLDRAANHYLQQCYRNRTPVRASAFATFLGMTHPYLSVVEELCRAARELLQPSPPGSVTAAKLATSIAAELDDSYPPLLRNRSGPPASPPAVAQAARASLFHPTHRYGAISGHSLNPAASSSARPAAIVP
jgi:hypothetical protein